MRKDTISDLINVALDDSHLSKLRTVRVEDDEHLDDLYNLIRNYSFKPFSKQLLRKLYKKPGSEICLEILYGTLGDGMEGYYEMEAKASVMAIRSKKANALTVLRFAHDPWFSTEVAATWADYRINSYLSRRKSIRKVNWYVDEKNLALQVALRKLDYIAQSLDNNPEELVFVKE